MIEIKNLHKFYGEAESRYEVLKGIDLEIHDEDFIVLLGASGSGKSTLLNVVSGLEPAEEGSVCYDGVDILKLNEKERTAFRRKTVAYIFQQYFLLPNLSVEKNVKMGADLSKNRNYKEMIQAVGLSEKLRKYPHELSGGEQQRVSVARALAKQPKVLFMDEPTGALDEATGRMVLDYLDKLRRDLHFTCVCVTHNENIAQMASKIMKMNSGKIVDFYENTEQKSAYEIGW